MVATDDGAGGDDKVDDSCNGNEATTAAALVSQMGAGEPMQVDGDGNFVLPQVDGPTDILLSEDEENGKIDLDEEPAPENATESTVDEPSAAVEQDNVDATESIHTEEPVVKEEVAPEATSDCPKSSTAAVGSETPEETESATANPPDEPMDISAEDAHLLCEKETKNLDSPSVDEAKATKSEISSAQSPAQVTSEQIPSNDVTNSTETVKIEQNDNNEIKDVKNELHLSENEKSPAPEDSKLSDESSMPRLSQSEAQETTSDKDEVTEPKANLPAETTLVKSNDIGESTDSALPALDVNTPVTTSTPVVAPNVQIKLESADEPMEQEKFPDLPISSINGIAAPLEKEMNEPAQKLHTPIKIEIKEDSAVPKKDGLKQEKINDTRSTETGDDSTALSTLASAALGSAESPVKVKNEQVSYINYPYRFKVT